MNIGETGILIRAKVGDNWGSFDIADPVVTDDQVREWLTEMAVERPEALIATAMILLGRKRG